MNRKMVCGQCGLCERLLTSEDDDGADVDWHGSLLVQKSQHQSARHMLTRKFKISEHPVDELTRRYCAVTFWAERGRPDGLESLPSYRKCRCCT